jgi:ketosteroid isomerase-like protein
MTAMSDSPEIELLHRTWKAMTGGDFAVLEESLAESAKWHGVEDGQLCSGRTEILEVMRRNLPGRLRGSIEETIQTGPRVLVAFRPEQPSDTGDRPLDDGIAYLVVTIGDGKIIELKGCADRATAQAYLASREAPAAQVLPPPLANRNHFGGE